MTAAAVASAVHDSLPTHEERHSAHKPFNRDVVPLQPVDNSISLHDKQDCATESDALFTIEQLVLPGFDEARSYRVVARKPRPGASPRHQKAAWHTAGVDSLLSIYAERLIAHGAATRCSGAYLYALRTTVRTAEQICGHSVTFVQIFENCDLLGRALVHDRDLTETRQLSKWTLAQRRSAVRSFASLLRPELEVALGTDPHKVLDLALRLVADQVGTGYRLTGGKSRRRGGHTPTASDIGVILEETSRPHGYRGMRNRAFFRILAETGARVNALRELDGSNCWLSPNGNMRLFLHDKGKREPREVELSARATSDLHAYASAFNRWALSARCTTRIRPGHHGSIWRNSGRGRWTYRDINATLQRACVAREITPFTPHAFRRAFATDAAELFPRHVVAQAGGWKGLERLDDHYIHPRAFDIWSRVACLAVPHVPSLHSEIVDDSTDTAF